MTTETIPDELAVDVTFTAKVKVALIAEPPVTNGQARDAWYMYRIQTGLHLHQMSLTGSWSAGMDMQGPACYLHAQEGGLYHLIEVNGRVTVKKGVDGDVVRQQAAEKVRQALFTIPEIHVLGKWFLQAPVEVRLTGGRDKVPHAARFVLDDDEDNPETPTFFGFTYGDTWNGWALPLLEREEAKRAVETLFNHKVEGADKPYAIYREEAGTFGFWDEDAEDYSTIEPEDIELPDEDEGRLVYDFGQGLVWREIDLRPGDWAYKYDISDEVLGVSFAEADRYNAFQRKAIADAFSEREPVASVVKTYLEGKVEPWLRQVLGKGATP